MPQPEKCPNCGGTLERVPDVETVAAPGLEVLVYKCSSCGHPITEATELIHGGTIEHDWEKYYRLKPGDVFVEVGGFWGRYAVRAAQRGCSKIVMIEPGPQNADRIEEAIREEKLQNVILVRKAVAERRGSDRFIVDGNPSGWRLDNSGNNPAYAKVEVETDTLEGILDTLGVDRVDLLGADCEMAEVPMLQFAGRWLRERRIRYIGIEAHGKEASDACLALLKACDYRILATEAGGAIIYATSE